MKRKLPIISIILTHILICVYSGSIYSQTSISEEIEQILTNNTMLESDSLKVVNLLSLSGQKFRYHSQSRPLLDKAGQIANRSGDDISLINYWYSMGNFFYFNSDLDSSKYYLDKALSVESVKNIPLLYSQILATQSGLQKINGQMSLALQTKLYAKEILIKLDTVDLDQSARIMRKGQISILDNSIGALYHPLKDFDQAIRYYTEAYELLLELDDHTSAGIVMGNIGEMYIKLYEYDRSEERRVGRD